MLNNYTIKIEVAVELCEIAYRIGASGFKAPNTDKEVLINDMYYFYYYLMRNTEGDASFFDSLDTIVSNGELDKVYIDWYSEHKEFI